MKWTEDAAMPMIDLRKKREKKKKKKRREEREGQGEKERLWATMGERKRKKPSTSPFRAIASENGENGPSAESAAMMSEGEESQSRGDTALRQPARVSG